MNRLNSVKSFLIESLNNYTDRKLDFAILHAIVAVELILKERLYKINPNLIYANIDSNDIKKFTVKLSILPCRLKNLGVDISPQDILLIKQVAE